MKCLVPPALVEAAICHFLSLYCRLLPSRDSVRFLMSFDRELYVLQGRTAVSYGEGVHTKHRHTRYHDFFVARISAGDSVLDVGCGMGALSLDIANRTKAKITGIDINGRSIEKARREFSSPLVQYIHGDAVTGLPRGSFQVVVLSNVLEHIEDRVSFLLSIVSNAKPDRILIRVPMFERDWRVPLKRELGVDFRLDKTHFTEYTHESFREEMNRSGLSISHLESRWGELWAQVENSRE